MYCACVVLLVLSCDQLASTLYLRIWNETTEPNTSQVVMRMVENKVSFGHMDSFDPDNKTIVAYLERFDIFIQANRVSNEKKVLVFLSVFGGKTYALLCSLLSPTLPKDKDFDELCCELKNHFEPKKVVIMKRSNFYCHNQEPSESM